MNILSRYMNMKKIPLRLKIKIRKYLEFLLKKKKIQNYEEEQNAINLLSKALRNELILEANKNECVQKIIILPKQEFY